MVRRRSPVQVEELYEGFPGPAHALHRSTKPNNESGLREWTKQREKPADQSGHTTRSAASLYTPCSDGQVAHGKAIVGHTPVRLPAATAQTVVSTLTILLLKSQDAVDALAYPTVQSRQMPAEEHVGENRDTHRAA